MAPFNYIFKRFVLSAVQFSFLIYCGLVIFFCIPSLQVLLWNQIPALTLEFLWMVIGTEIISISDLRWRLVVIQVIHWVMMNYWCVNEIINGTMHCLAVMVCTIVCRCHIINRWNIICIFCLSFLVFAETMQMWYQTSLAVWKWTDPFSFLVPLCDESRNAQFGDKAITCHFVQIDVLRKLWFIHKSGLQILV